MTKHDDDDDDVVKDGQTIRVPLMMMDALQRSVADDCIIDSTVGHRPGYVFLSDSERQRRAALYDKKDQQLSDQWRGLPKQATPREPLPQSTKDARTTAYEAYERRLADAWRHP